MSAASDPTSNRFFIPTLLMFTAVVSFCAVRVTAAPDEPSPDAGDDSQQEAREAADDSTERPGVPEPPSSDDPSAENPDDEDRGSAQPPRPSRDQAPGRGRSSNRGSRVDSDDSRRDPSGTPPTEYPSTRGSSRNERTHSRDADHSQRRDTRQRDLGLSFSTDSSSRITVGEIKSGSPFKSSGIRRGDVVVSVNGQRLRNQDDFNRYYYRSRTRVPVVVLRDGTEETIYLEPMSDDTSHHASGGGYLGVMLDQRRRDAAVVRQANPNSPAERAGIRAGDVIETVEDEQITSPEQLTDVISGYAPGTNVQIETARDDGRTQSLTVRLGSRPATPVTGRRSSNVIGEDYTEDRAPSNRSTEIESYDDSGVIIDYNQQPTRRERGLRGRRNR